MEPLLNSFLFGGFESTAAWIERRWIDNITLTRHDRQLREDYQLVASAGMGAVREGLRWPLIERSRGQYDWSSLDPIIDLANEFEFGVVWSMFHFGYPPFLHPLAEDFAEVFQAYCGAAADHIRERFWGPLFFNPIVEPSFLSYIAADQGRFAPYLTGCGPSFKRALCAAAIRGIDAIKTRAPESRIVNIDPICLMASPAEPDEHTRAYIEDFNHRQVYQAWDIISGRVDPELGGSPAHLDIVGINYYWTNQWECGLEGCPLTAEDPRLLPLSALLRQVWDRYGCDMMITETAHTGCSKVSWIYDLKRESEAAIAQGLPLRAVCYYPLIGMFSWYSGTEYQSLGAWDLEPDGGELLKRVPVPGVLDALRSFTMTKGRWQESRGRISDFSSGSSMIPK